MYCTRNDFLCTKSLNDSSSFIRVIWLLIPCFKRLKFLGGLFDRVDSIKPV